MRSDDPAGMGWRRSRGGSGGRGGWSPLTVIIVLNLAVFVPQFGFGVLGEEVVIKGERVFQPEGETSRELLLRGHLWTLVTYMFVHGGLMHILLNLLMIFMAGRLVIQIAGTKHFLRVYFLSGLLGALAQVATTEHRSFGHT